MRDALGLAPKRASKPQGNRLDKHELSELVKRGSTAEDVGAGHAEAAWVHPFMGLVLLISNLPNRSLITSPSISVVRRDKLIKPLGQGKHLAEHSRNVTYPEVSNFVLWVLAEISIVACDILEGNGATGLAISLLGAMTQSLPPLSFWCFPGRSRDPFKASR
ncbi:hypothetical protein EZV62_016998 [Acer yangbiense]|uniref:Uncharacterized protein n=1 Tax=Acer yangbiense TaxID=1000413 RepID=A0A5C7HQS6_9ROSI|nr:hypothetical protein EZV62_016998 [Acer yangbiense]